MARKNAHGNYYEFHPLDAAILERLPLEGSSVGYHQLAATVKRLTEDLNRDVEPQGRVTSDQVSARLRSLSVAGYVVTTKLLVAHGGTGWQRTRKGELLLAEKTGVRPASGGLGVVEGGGQA